MAAVAILDFGNFKFLTVGTLKRVELRLHASGRPPSWIFKSWKFQLPVPFGGPICVTVQNFAKIGQTVKEIWLIFDFTKWRPPPSWIFGNFDFLTVGTLKRFDLRLHAKFWRNRSKRGWDIAIFLFFKMAAVRHVRLVLRLLGPPTKSTWWSLRMCKIWW